MEYNKGASKWLYGPRLVRPAGDERAMALNDDTKVILTLCIWKIASEIYSAASEWH